MFFEEVLLLQRDGGVRFVVVGGTAVILHGVPQTTLTSISWSTSSLPTSGAWSRQ